MKQEPVIFVYLFANNTLKCAKAFETVPRSLQASIEIVFFV